MPAGRIDLTFTPLLESLDGAPGIPTSVPEAPEGGGYIGIERSMSRVGVGALSNVAGIVEELEPTTFALVADGRRYPVDAPAEVVRGTGSGDARDPDTLEDEGKRSVYVAIEGDPDDISLEVTYDDVTQSVDVLTGERAPGRAAGMYEASVLDAFVGQGECGTVEPSGPLPRVDFDEAYCQVLPGTVLVPYTSELGWAPEGRRWVVVNVLARFQRVLRWVVTSENWYDDPQMTQYGTVDFADDVTLDGRGPVESIAEESSFENQHKNTYTFEVGTDDPLLLRVRHTYSSDRIRRGDVDGPSSVKVELDKTVDLEF